MVNIFPEALIGMLTSSLRDPGLLEVVEYIALGIIT